MKVYIISFTETGGKLAKKLEQSIPDSIAYGNDNYSEKLGLLAFSKDIKCWTENHFKQGNGLIFVGATGIAVRAIAPYIVSKLTDPAVVSLDEKGRYAVPLLSGHVGGANKLAQTVAKISEGIAVISTATDLNDIFAIDSWAKEKGYYIANPENIKIISAALLAGEKVGLVSEFPLCSLLPQGFVLSHQTETKVLISEKEKQLPNRTLMLIPKSFYLGIGCRKGIDSQKLEETILGILVRKGLKIQHFNGVASVNLKKEEKAILDFCEKYKLDYQTYSPDQLREVKGEFPASAFVEKTVGVDNVCQRSAMILGDELVLAKTSEQGVTVAISKKKWRVEF